MSKGFVVTLCIIGIVCIALCVVNTLQPTFDKEDYIVKSYHIKQGDTLYELGCKYCCSGDDVREWVCEVERLNGCTSLIYTGDTIKIYVAKG